MKNLKLYILLAVVSVFAFSSCEEDVEAPGTNYVTFGDDTYSTLVDPGSSATVDIPIYTANITGGDRSFSVSVDGSSAEPGTFNVPSTVTVPGGTNEGTLRVSLDDPGIAQNSIVIALEPEMGLSVGNTTRVIYTQSCVEVTATIDFILDYWASETSFDVLDANGDAVVSGGDYSDGYGGTATETFQLCSGRDYTLVVYDAYGDGMCSDIAGSYELSINGVVYVAGGGCGFSSQSNDFSTP